MPSFLTRVLSINFDSTRKVHTLGNNHCGYKRKSHELYISDFATLIIAKLTRKVHTFTPLGIIIADKKENRMSYLIGPNNVGPNISSALIFVTS